MTEYTLPKPTWHGDIPAYSQTNVEAAYAAGQRDMLERAIAVFESAGPKDAFTATLIRVALKEILNEPR